MEKKELTAELAAVKMKKKDAIHKRRKWRGGKGAEGGGSESKKEERDLGGGEDITQEGSYQRNEPEN